MGRTVKGLATYQIPGFDFRYRHYRNNLTYTRRLDRTAAYSMSVWFSRDYKPDVTEINNYALKENLLISCFAGVIGCAIRLCYLKCIISTCEWVGCTNFAMFIGLSYSLWHGRFGRRNGWASIKFCVWYEPRLKKQLIIEHIIKRSAIRGKISGEWN